MKRIETLTRSDCRVLVHTLNDAALEGEAPFCCYVLGNSESRIDCDSCPVKTACDLSLNSDGGEIIKTFRGWLAWLCGDVGGERINSGYRVLLTERINHYRIVRPDGTNIYAVGQPLPLLPRDYDRNSALAITDVFASRYGAVCILVEDAYSGEKWLYSDIL